jgi:hypothetical protein
MSSHTRPVNEEAQFLLMLSIISFICVAALLEHVGPEGVHVHTLKCKCTTVMKEILQGNMYTSLDLMPADLAVLSEPQAALSMEPTEQYARTIRYE